MISMLFRAKVTKVEQRSRALRAYRVDPEDPNSDIKVDREDLGWFIVFDEWRMGWGVGSEKPPFDAGDEVEVQIRKASS
jgi:hypothetical protein